MAGLIENSAMDAYLKSNQTSSAYDGQELSSALRERFEAKSGVSFDDVRVHYSSDKPKKLGMLAYAQGNEIHLGAGQEDHLDHEAIAVCIALAPIDIQKALRMHVFDGLPLTVAAKRSRITRDK